MIIKNFSKYFNRGKYIARNRKSSQKSISAMDNRAETSNFKVNIREKIL